MRKDEFYNRFCLTQEEQFYQKLYQKHPELYEVPVNGWNEFQQRWYETNKDTEGIVLPDEAPTPITAMFMEKDFFMELEEEVTIIVNCRYCPPFLHSLEFIKLICVMRGSCRFYYEGEWHLLKAGMICLVAPDVLQTVLSETDEDIVLNLLIRRSTLAESFSELLKMENGVIIEFFLKMLYQRPDGKALICRCRNFGILEPYIIDLYAECDSKKKNGRLSKKSLMLIILGHLVREKKENYLFFQPEKKIRKYPMIEYHMYMKKHLDTVTLSGMAQTFWVSEGYLSRYIHRETGKTFRHLLLEMRMKKAAELLRTTDCSIERILEMVGYRDESIFFRNFKEYYGMTPMIWRRKKQKV